MNISSNAHNKKALQFDQQSSVLVKRASDGLMTTTMASNDEQIRRRSSLSTEMNIRDRSSRKGFNTVNSSISITHNLNKDLSTSSKDHLIKSTGVSSPNENSDEKVIIIDTTAVSLVYLFLIEVKIELSCDYHFFKSS